MRGKVAVVTGAASGIGRAIAEGAARRDMTVVLVDVDEERLAVVTQSLVAKGAPAYGAPCDVANAVAVRELAAWVENEVGPTWLLVNNAGVFLPDGFLTRTAQEWDYVLSVNLGGVVNGLRSFLPGMTTRDDGHVVNTASVDGLLTLPSSASYVASKHAVTALSETLARELAGQGSNVGMSVLCPGAVRTDILNSSRRRASVAIGGSTFEGAEESGYPELDGLMEPDDVATHVFEAIGHRQFWVLTHREQYRAAIRARAEEIVAGTGPSDASVDPNFRRSAEHRTAT